MAQITISGDTSGSITLVAPAVSGSTVLTLPTTSATLITDSSGVLNIGSGQVYKDASGNVGIGTSSPAGQLGVNGVVAIGNQAATGSTGTLRLLAAGGVNYIQSGLNTTSASTAPLVFGSINAGNEWMRIDSSGNMGIGTSSPDIYSKLTLNGAQVLGGASTSTNFLGLNRSVSGALLNTGIGGFDMYNSGVKGQLEYYTTTGVVGAALFLTSTPSMEFIVNNAERMRIAANGAREFSDALGVIQYAEGSATWGNVSSTAINLTTVFPDLVIASKALSIQMQIITNSSGVSSTTQLALLLRRVDGTWAAATSIANITSGGTTISVAGAGTTITITFGAAGQYGIAVIKAMSQG